MRRTVLVVARASALQPAANCSLTALTYTADGKAVPIPGHNIPMALPRGLRG